MEKSRGKKTDRTYIQRKKRSAHYEWMLSFGHDHAFLCSWFLCLAFVALIAAGAVLALVVAGSLLPGESAFARWFAAPEGWAFLWAMPFVAKLLAIAAVLAGMVLLGAEAVRLSLLMGEVYVFPRWFVGQSRRGVPRSAICFVTGLSVLLVLPGSGALGWLICAGALGLAVACGYAAARTFRKGGEELRRGRRVFWIAAAALLTVLCGFLIVPNPVFPSAVRPVFYLVLAFWCILGFFFYWRTFHLTKYHMSEVRITDGVVLFVLVFFSSTMWFLRTVTERTDDTQIRMTLIRSGAIQFLLVMIGLAALLAVYFSLHRESEEMEREKLRAEESSRAKMRFLSNMAHDIRTPMNAIIGYTNLAIAAGEDAEKLRSYLYKIQFSGDHLISVINDVLEVNRIESGRMKLEEFECDLGGMLEDICVLVADQVQEKRLSLILDYSGAKDRRVYCDKNRFDRVLINLLSNAIKFTPEGGHIWVTLSQTDKDARGYGNYEYRVRDDGVGMSADFATRVFDAFEQERTSTETGLRGSGLGMAITKGLLDMMGGMIDVETAPDKGTEFTVRVRFRLMEDQEVLPEEEAKAAHDFTGKRLLLVDDNLVNREIAKEILKNYGFDLEEAVDGQNAVEMVADSEPGYYDLILMDIRMPIMDGYEASRKIRTMSDPMLSQIPIVAMTANAFDEDVRESRASGMNGHIAKPIDIPKMIGVLEEVFAKVENDKIRAELQY